MIESDIIKTFAHAGYQLNAEALKALVESRSTSDIINTILNRIDTNTIVVGLDHIVSFNEAAEQTTSHPYDPYTPTRPKTEEELTNPQYTGDKEDDENNTCEIDILSDITNQSTCIGEYEEFVQYFRDRYSRLSELIRKRVDSRPIESLKKQQRGDDRENISIIGMVKDIKTTSNGHKLIELEDTTGSIPALILKKDEELLQAASHVLHDEVIGITGSPARDRGLFIVRDIIWPEIPAIGYSLKNMETKKSGKKAVLISDTHIGSNTFLEDAWLRFISWLRGEINDEKTPASDNIKYLVIAGDLVDGIGIYPGQEKELLINDIYAQYEQAAEYIKEIPKHINIIISPGNHDAVRQAEPQPCLPDEITRLFNKNNTTFVGNPAMVGLEGIKILIYHGRSIDDFVAAMPNVNYKDPTIAMKEMLKRRHLSPIYGGRVLIAPEKKDHFVIDKIPDILHCGHVHTANISKYRNVTLINSGTWQSQTEFQKRVNLKPDPAIATTVDLNTLQTQMIKFL